MKKLKKKNPPAKYCLIIYLQLLQVLKYDFYKNVFASITYLKLY